MSRSLLLLALLWLSPSVRAQSFCPLAEDQKAQRIVLCRPDVPFADCRAAAASAGCDVVRELPAINAVVIVIPTARLAVQERRLRAMIEVQSVEPDKKLNWLKAVGDDFDLPTPAQVMRPFVKALPAKRAAAAAQPPWGVARVNAPAAWPVTRGAGVKVAVIDTGVDSSHPALRAAVAGGVNVAEGADPKDFADDQGHGTHVAGTIAAARQSNGVIGVAPKVRLYAVKVLDKNGNGSFSDVIAGLQWAIDNHMDVANMSLGADDPSDALKAAVQAAARAGVTLIAAAGNSSGGPLSYPGAYPEAIAVAASNEDDTFAKYSSKGPNVAFIAPGTNVFSTLPGGKYGTESGTSMATPHVTGLAALAISVGARGPEGVRATLQGAAAPLPGLNGQQQGAGMIDAGRLVGSALAAAAGAR